MGQLDRLQWSGTGHGQASVPASNLFTCDWLLLAPYPPQTTTICPFPTFGYCPKHSIESLAWSCIYHVSHVPGQWPSLVLKVIWRSVPDDPWGVGITSGRWGCDPLGTAQRGTWTGCPFLWVLNWGSFLLLCLCSSLGLCKWAGGSCNGPGCSHVLLRLPPTIVSLCSFVSLCCFWSLNLTKITWLFLSRFMRWCRRCFAVHT